MKRTTIIAAVFLTFSGLVSAREVKDSLDVAKHNAVTAEYLLLGKVSGLDITSETGSMVSAINTHIRGLNSLSSGTQPLWIVDGAVLNPGGDVDNPFWEFGTQTYTAPQGSLLGINPYDIESIEVLKDLSATAIYGSRGANGVVIINTRYPRTSRPVGLQWNTDVSSDGSNSHTVSLGGFRNNTSYYISAFYRDLSSSEADANYGGFRFNFNSKANSAVKVGLSGMMSLGNHSALNPMLDADADIDDNSKEMRTTDTFFVTINPFKGLAVKGEVGVDYRVKNRYEWYGITTDFGAAREGACSISTMALFQYNASVNAVFDRYFGKHHIAVSAQADILSGSPEYNVMCGYVYYDYSLRSKGISIASNTSTNRANNWDWTQLGGYAKAAYEFDGKAGFDLAWRIDRDKTFEKDFTSYPSANAWVDLARFISADNDILSSLKIKGGWGKAGGSTYIPYQWMENYTPQCPAINVEYQAFYKGFTKTVSTEANAGIEAGLLGGRIKAEFGYYSKKTAETLDFYCEGVAFGDQGYWKYTDMNSILREEGTLSNNGFEFSLDARVLRMGDFKWDLGLNGAYNINIVESTPWFDDRSNPLCDRWTNSNIVGYSAHQIVGYELNTDGTSKDRNEDGKINSADMTRLGSTLPKFTAGLSTTLSYGRFSLDAMATARFGSSYLDISKLFAADTATDKALVTEDMVVDGSAFIPARATLTYDVPMGRLSKLSNLKVSLTAASSMPAYGYVAFPARISCIGGICLTF